MARELPLSFWLCGKESMEKSAGPGMYSVWKNLLTTTLSIITCLRKTCMHIGL